MKILQGDFECCHSCCHSADLKSYISLISRMHFVPDLLILEVMYRIVLFRRNKIKVGGKEEQRSFFCVLNL